MGRTNPKYLIFPSTHKLGFLPALPNRDLMIPSYLSYMNLPKATKYYLMIPKVTYNDKKLSWVPYIYLEFRSLSSIKKKNSKAYQTRRLPDSTKVLKSEEEEGEEEGK